MQKGLAVGIMLVVIGASMAPCINANTSSPAGVTRGPRTSHVTADLGTLSGYVTDSVLNPIKGAWVRLYFHNTSRENYSDATGYYHVTDIPLCNCTKNATCSKEGYHTAWVYLSIGENTTYDFVLIPKGLWLYVGGQGPNNYTKIQDAIDHASDGDTVFVYDDSSPYHENVIVNKSINLIGENQESTIIDGMYRANTVWIPASSVHVHNFTVINCKDDRVSAGIFVTEKLSWPLPDPPRSSDVHIVNCTVKNNTCGIRFINTGNGEVASCHIHHNRGSSIYMNNGSYITIHDCAIHENGQVVPEGYYSGGIDIADQEWLEGSDNIYISDCNISNNVWGGIEIHRASINIEIESNLVMGNSYCGIYIWDLPSKKTLSHIRINKNNISYNGVASDGRGIGLQDCKKSVEIIQNTITDNHDGVYLLRSSLNSILENNLIGNYRNAFFKSFCFLNHWDKNYWSDWQGSGPKLIKGTFGGAVIPWVNFDWHPALKPYNSGG